jgi:dihydrofolate reductase
MRKIIVAGFVSLDGVMQAPGGPDEDKSGGFRFGGWLFPLWDESIGAAIDETFAPPFDLLLGRKTYDIFAAHWPKVERDPAAKGYQKGDADMSLLFDGIGKYVATHRPESLSWQNSKSLGADAIAGLRKLKQEDGPTLVTQGSTELVQQLLAHDLVDELKLMTFPLVLGAGKRLFGNNAAPATFKLMKSVAGPKGGVVSTYEKAGGIEVGTFAPAK